MKNWIDTCWDNFLRAFGQKLTPADLQHMHDKTYGIAGHLTELLEKHKMRVEAMVAPSVNIVHVHDVTFKYANTYKLPYGAPHDLSVIAYDIFMLAQAQSPLGAPPLVFRPYWLVIPGSCDGTNIDRVHFRTRFGCWADE